MGLTLEETLEQTKKEWKARQEEIRKGAEKQRKLGELRKIKPDLPKPTKTGRQVLNELFEAVIGIEPSVYFTIIASDYFGLFQATKNGIIAGFWGTPAPAGLELIPLSEDIREATTKLTLKQERNKEENFIELYGDPRLVSGCLSQTLILERKFGLAPPQVLVFKDKYDDLSTILKNPTHFVGCHDVASSESVISYVHSVDKQFSYELSTGDIYANPKYSLITPLLQFTYPISDNVLNRSRDKSIVLKEVFEYRTRKLALNIGEFAEQCQIAEKLEHAIQQKWQTLTELFEYWVALNKDLKILNSLYHQAEKE